MIITSLSQLAAVVRARRVELGLTQAALAEAAGVSRWWVSEFESGRARAELGLVLRLLDALGLEVRINPAGSDPTATEPAQGTPQVDLDDLLDEYGSR